MLTFLCVATVLVIAIPNLNAQLPFADTIFVFDATMTDPTNCQCQKNLLKYMAKYQSKQPANNRMGLIACASTTTLLYRLTWTFNLTQWNQIVQGIVCTGDSTLHLDLAALLATRMFTNGGRSSSIKSLIFQISKVPVAFTTQLGGLAALGVNLSAGVIVSTDLSTSDVENLPFGNLQTFPSYCAQFNFIRGQFPIQ